MHSTTSVLRFAALIGIAAALGSCGGDSSDSDSGLIPVPDVGGQQSSEAKTTVRDAGLQASVIAVPGESPGTVLSQDPEAGTESFPGGTVTMTVSATPEEAEPPPPSRTPCDGTVEFTNAPRLAEAISASGVSCGAAKALVGQGHRILPTCEEGMRCLMSGFSCSQTYFGGDAIDVRCEGRRGTAQWKWAEY